MRFTALRRPLRLARHLTVAALLAALPVPCHAQALPQLFYTPGNGYRPKDFSVVRADDGRYHAFFIRTRMSDNLDIDISHASSLDLVNWTAWNTALAPRHGENVFDRDFVWAPCVVKKDGYYWMFYTGVNHPGWPYYQQQQIGLARATSLDGPWTRLQDGPVLACDGTTLYCDMVAYPNGYSPDFRDPFVFPDPANPGHWLMYVAAHSKADLSKMVIGAASSDGDFLHWTSLGEVADTRQPKLESPHVVHHGADWFLFSTANGTSAPDCGSDTIVLRRKTDPWTSVGGWGGVESLKSKLAGADYVCDWTASEYFDSPSGGIFAAVDGGNGLVFHNLLWDASPGFSFATEGWVASMTWNLAQAIVGDPVTLTLYADGTEWHGREAEIEYFQSTPGGLLPFSPAGWPARVRLTGPGTAISRRAPAGPEPDENNEWDIVARLKDQSKQTGLLHVVPRVNPGHDPFLDGAGAVRGQVGTHPLALALRVTSLAPERAEFLAEIPRATTAHLEVFDITGRVVARTDDVAADTGALALRWNLRDGAGRGVTSGIYYVRLVTATGEWTRTRLAVVR